MGTAALLGTGLIGASLGIALRGAGWTVTAWDPDRGALAKAASVGALDREESSLEAAVAGRDLVVLAGPVRAVVETAGSLRTEALVTDVAGVKGPVVRAAAGLPHFVGGHPMAGRETSGPEGASGSLFRGAPWVLTSDGARPEDVRRMASVVETLGASPVVMTAAEHDAAVALASHLPHLTAATLVRCLADHPSAPLLAAGGFRDLTRVAMSDPEWWTDVLRANATAVSESLRRLVGELLRLAEMLEEGDAAGLEERLASARDIRRAMAPPVATVGVLLEDRPGEVAQVGHALAESGVDLRDLQLRHATHGGGGVLTLSVRAGEAPRLREALVAEGFRLVETA